MQKRERFLVFIVCLIAAYLPGMLGSIAIGNETDSEWFDSIKPSITPPDFVFPIAWNLIYFLIAISIYFAWLNNKKRGKIMLVYATNLIANGLWSYIYFGLHKPGLALIDITIIIITTAMLIWLNWKNSRISSYLLIPYLLWLAFAVVLNYLSV